MQVDRRRLVDHKVDLQSKKFGHPCSKVKESSNLGTEQKIVMENATLVIKLN